MLDLISNPDNIRRLWANARARRLARMTDEEQVAFLRAHPDYLANHPNGDRALRRMNTDVAAAPLPPVVDKDFTELERAEFDKHNEADRFE